MVRDFVNTLISVQEHLDERYHIAYFVRDRILTAVDIPAVQSSLRDLMLRT